MTEDTTDDEQLDIDEETFERALTATDGPLATSDEFDGEWCIECVQEHKKRQQAVADLEEIEAEL